MTCEPTIEQLIYEYKIIFHGLLIELPKIPPPQAHQSVQELKHKRCIGITLRYRHQVYVLMFDMTESCGAESEDGGADLSIGDDLNAKDIGETGPAIVAKGAKYQVLAFLIKDENAGEHSSRW